MNEGHFSVPAKICASPALQTGRLIWPSECRRLPALSGIEWMALLSPGEDIRRTEEGVCGGDSAERGTSLCQPPLFKAGSLRATAPAPAAATTGRSRESRQDPGSAGG